ncbi:MAG: hypothetical protein KDJ65_05470 [Anaerolineae bacterium]|nr:hypothetical protein [Anaerolineae bacterium]
MFSPKFDTNSNLHLDLPDKNKPLEVVRSVRGYLSFEERLPLEERLPQTPRLIELLQEWNASKINRSIGEHQRSVAAEEIEVLDSEVNGIVRDIRKTLDAAFPRQPTQAKGWGFNAKQSTKSIILPQTRNEHLEVLDSYITKEQSRPEEERFTSPPLAQVIEIRDKLVEQLDIRLVGQNQREKSAAQISTITLEMYNQLQGAAVYLLNFRFNFILTVDLQDWGFNVVTRRSDSEDEEDTEATVDAAADTNATPEASSGETTSETTSTNGTATNGTYTNGSVPEDADAVVNGLNGGGA